MCVCACAVAQRAVREAAEKAKVDLEKLLENNAETDHQSPAEERLANLKQYTKVC